jgi:hypothetical protein
MSVSTVVILMILALAVIGALGLSFFYIRPLKDILRERAEEKPLIGDLDEVEISEHSIRRLTHSFANGENELFWGDRLDLASMGGAIAMAAVALLLLGLGFFVLAEWNFLWMVSLVFFVPGFLILFPFVWNEWLKWRGEYLLISVTNFRHDKQFWAPAIWLWNNERHDPLPLHVIISIEIRSTIWGRICRYATVEFKYIQQQGDDEATREVKFVRNTSHFRAVIEERIAQAKKARVPEVTVPV